MDFCRRIHWTFDDAGKTFMRVTVRLPFGAVYYELDIDYFDSRVLTGGINKRPVKYDIFGTMFRRQSPKATELFELHVVSRGVSMLPSITNAAGGTMRSGREGAAFAVKAPRFRQKRPTRDRPFPVRRAWGLFLYLPQRKRQRAGSRDPARFLVPLETPSPPAVPGKASLKRGPAPIGS